MYTLINSVTGERCECDERSWEEALRLAKENGWEPEGTRIDFDNEIERQWDDRSDYGWNLLMMLGIHMMRLRWDGNYVDREHQVVPEPDSYGLYRALEGSGVGGELLSFIRKGPFYIT